MQNIWPILHKMCILWELYLGFYSKFQMEYRYMFLKANLTPSKFKLMKLYVVKYVNVLNTSQENKEVQLM